MSKIFQFVDGGQSFQRVLEHNLFSHWCIHPSYCLWYHLSFIFFPLHPYSNAGKTAVYSSLTCVLVETFKFYMNFVKFAIAGHLLPLLLTSSLYFSWSLNWCSCDWYWEPPKTCSCCLCWYLHHLKVYLLFPHCSILQFSIGSIWDPPFHCCFWLILSSQSCHPFFQLVLRVLWCLFFMSLFQYLLPYHLLLPSL